MNIFLVIGISIILILAVIAAYLQWQVHKLLKHEQQQREQMESAREEARGRINNSIQIIARSVIDEQVGYAEASIRIAFLLNQLNVDGAQREPYVAFDKLADAVAHIPILDQWRDLPRDRKQEYEKQIEHHENELSDFVKDAADKIIGVTF